MIKSPILPPFKRFCVTIGNLPSSYVDSMSYYECIMWLCKYLKDTVIPAINENAEAVNELIHWFENLDVQDEIDNKLDEMVESGELQEIISEYLNSTAVFGFDTIADMLSATNLIDGSYARTCGSTNFNNGSGALYKIRTVENDDVVDGVNLIAMTTSNTLVAEKIKDIPDNTSIVTVGANNCTYTSVAEAVTYAKTIATNNNPVSIFIMGGTYTEELTMTNCHGISLIGCGFVKIQYESSYPHAPLYVSGDVKVQNIHFYNSGIGTYALHLDPSNTGVTGTCEFINCTFEVGNVNTSAVGLGTASNTIMKFYNCIFKNNGSNAPFFLHTNPHMNSVNSQVWVVGCEFIGKNLKNTAIQIDNGGYDNGYTTSDDQFHFINNSSTDSKLVIYKRTTDTYLGYIPYSDNGVKLRPDSYGNDLVGLNYDYTTLSNAIFYTVKPSVDTSGTYYYAINFKGANLYNVTVGDVGTVTGTAITGVSVHQTSSTGILLKDTTNTGKGEGITVRLTLTPKNSNYGV